jgi:hypothetical protein
MLPDFRVLSAAASTCHQQGEQKTRCPARGRPLVRPDGLFDLLHVNNVFQLAGIWNRFIA